ncbi:MAG: MBL fold metallo-hydrolase [Oscillospiraceae bacterium]|nr:MBL fold metallo-hydrolase [Oscillospiraceae bacterium]
MIMLENINLIDCGFTNCFVIRGEKGDILVDTGREEYRDHIETWLLNYSITLIILTHGHADHIANAAYFSELYNAPVMISPYDMRLARDNTCRPYYITNPLGHIMKNRTEMTMHTHITKFSPTIYAEEGMDLSPYGIDGVIVDLQGHTRGSIGILCKSCAGYDLYAGDAVMNIPVPSMPMICESPKKARETMERIITLAPDRILCGHGSPIICGQKSHRLFIDRF